RRSGRRGAPRAGETSPLPQGEERLREQRTRSVWSWFESRPARHWGSRAARHGLQTQKPQGLMQTHATPCKPQAATNLRDSRAGRRRLAGVAEATRGTSRPVVSVAKGPATCTLV